MELRICFMHSVFCIMVFALVPICSLNYDAQLAIKMKEMDLGRLKSLEYGEKLTSIEEARFSVTQRAKTPNLDILMLPPSHRSPTKVTLKTGEVVTRCTTSKPLPKLNPYFLPNELDGQSNTIESDYDNKANKNPYLAPAPGKTPFHYIDDEK